MNGSSLTRRGFLQRIASAAALAAAPSIVPASARGAAGRFAPSNRIVMGGIGLGSNGSGHLQSFLRNAGVQVVAVCDVDAARREKAKKTAEQHYAGQSRGGSFKGIAAYNDFRELIARPDIDAVWISTPDHWHALPVIAAAEAHKDIYAEKPLALTIEQGQKMCEAVKRNGVVFQQGTQLRSMQTNRLVCELARNGRLGKIKEVHVCAGSDPEIGPQPEMPVPPGFDYDMWLGPAPWAPYTEKRCHGSFRFISDYAGGPVDHGAHYCDMAQWGLGTEDTGPVEFEGRGDFPRDGLYNTALRYRVECTYPSGIKMIYSHQPPSYATFYGTEGQATAGDGGGFANPSSLMSSAIGPDEVHLYDSADHHQNFLDCIRTRERTAAPIEVAHRSVSIAHICNIAMRLERKLRWDPAAERFVNDPEADSYLSRPMRSPWTL